MSPEPLQVPLTTPYQDREPQGTKQREPGLAQSQQIGGSCGEDHEHGDGAISQGHGDSPDSVSLPQPAASEIDTQARDIVRLFQCRLCSRPFHDVVTLPCGKSICRQCVPETHTRVNITYPSSPERLHGFQCPFSDCAKEHAVGDCSLDVILNKAAHFMRDQVERGRLYAAEKSLSTQIRPYEPWDATDVSSLLEDDGSSRIMGGGKLVATWALAEEGALKFEDEISYAGVPMPSGTENSIEFESDVLSKAKEATRSEMDCQVCYALFYDPMTTGCGHTFCRSCLHRILDHSRYCPICRRQLAINPLLNRASCPSNESISSIIQMFWSDELVARKDAIAAEAFSHNEFDTALFVCTLAFPLMPTFLHVFEPRYRLMVRRALEGNRTFGMILPRRARTSEDCGFYEFGTLLRIINVQFYPDGRSLIETVGLSRFKVLGHGPLDGYIVGQVERIDDVGLEEEESAEATEVSEPSDGNHGDSPQSNHGDAAAVQASTSEERIPTTAAEIETMSTQDLMRFASRFVARMRTEGVPWLTQRMLEINGECPDSPEVFPWWFASMLPVRDVEKYRLLGTTSVRDRLKICCCWIVEWETSRWSLHGCAIL